MTEQRKGCIWRTNKRIISMVTMKVVKMDRSLEMFITMLV